MVELPFRGQLLHPGPQPPVLPLRDARFRSPRAGRPARPCAPTRAAPRGSLPGSLATEAYVRPGLARYSATASARDSGEYFDVLNGNPCPVDLHDPMIRVSTIKGKGPSNGTRIPAVEHQRVHQYDVRHRCDAELHTYKLSRPLRALHFLAVGFHGRCQSRTCADRSTWSVISDLQGRR